MMNKIVDIPAVLYDDEAVCFISDRYHGQDARTLRSDTA